jgi:hypothetical protein
MIAAPEIAGERSIARSAKREARVGREILEPSRAAPVAMRLLRDFNAPEHAQSFATRIARRHAALHVLGGLELYVQADLVIEIAFSGASPQQCAQAQCDALERRHDQAFPSMTSTTET